jgi:hypothetical protein
MWPQIPADIKTLSAAEARAFAREIRLAAAAALAAGVDADARAEVDQYLALRDDLKALADSKDLAAALAEDDSDEPVEAPAEEAAEETEEAPVESTEEASHRLPTSFGAPSAPALAAVGTVTEARPVVRTAPEYLYAVSGVQGKNPGDAFDSWSEVAAAAARRGASLNPTTSERFEIARIKGNYSADRVLSEDVMLNAAKFEPDELTAAFCPPATPSYNLACANSLRRPVFGSLPSFQAPRGRVSIMPSPALSDVTTGFGQWTSTNDSNVNAVKSDCQTITCGSPTEYEMYGVYRCLTVKNMMAMTYPELVEAYLNRLGAAQARLAEELMLNAMATASTTVNGRQLGYGGSVTVTSTILNYLALYQETQRWDITENMKAWLPRWTLYAMKMDIFRRRQTSGGLNQVPSDAEIEGMFRDVGVDVTFFMDRPTWAVAVPSIATANSLNLLPQSVQILIAPPGKFAAIDRGELAIGVTGNNIYRDNESNRRNQFTFFFENFEGVVNTTSCPAHILDIPACWNGVQIDDIVINCQGGDEVGYQS